VSGLDPTAPDDAWEIFTRSISRARLESERFGPTRALNVAKNALARESFNTPGHRALVVQHEFRGVLWRASLERALGVERLAAVGRWVDDVTDTPAPRRVRAPKPKPAPVVRVKHVPQEVFTARQYEIALAALDNKHGLPLGKYAA